MNCIKYNKFFLILVVNFCKVTYLFVDELGFEPKPIFT